MTDYSDTERIDYTEEGHLDDIAIGDVELFRMERMNDGSFWIRLYRKGKKDVVFWLNATKNENPTPHDRSEYRIDGSHDFDE